MGLLSELVGLLLIAVHWLFIFLLALISLELHNLSAPSVFWGAGRAHLRELAWLRQEISHELLRGFGA